MATLNLAAFLKEQQARLELGRQQVAAARLAADTGKPLPPETLRINQKRELDNLKLQLARAEAARAQALERYDAQIARLKAAISRQEEDGKKIDEILAGGRPKPKSAGVKKAPRRGTKR